MAGNKAVQTTGSEELYICDGNGNVASKTDGDGYVTEYTCNPLDLVPHISYNGAKEVSYQYNYLLMLIVRLLLKSCKGRL